MEKDNKNALLREQLDYGCNHYDNYIIAQNVQEFMAEDFGKSGISQSVINDYKDKKFLKCTPTSWILNYPDLLTNERTSYTTTRLKNPINGNKYIRPKDETSRLFKPLHLAPETLNNPNEYIILTEGEKKAIKAVQEGFNCIAVPGVWCWKSKKTEDGLIPDMHKINWENKEVYLCFDNDICYKSQVLNALRALTYQLQDFGAIVKNIKLPTGREVKNG